MLRRIYKELVLIRKTLQAIRGDLENFSQKELTDVVIKELKNRRLMTGSGII